MAQRYTIKEYENLAASRDLIYLGGAETPLATTPTKWQCKFCDTVMKKSLRAVKNTKKGCLCQSSITHQEDKYVELALAWNIEWLGNGDGKRPRNTKTPTQWRLPNGEVLIASYYDLAYKGKMPNYVKKALGLPYRKRGGAVNV